MQKHFQENSIINKYNSSSLKKSTAIVLINTSDYYIFTKWTTIKGKTVNPGVTVIDNSAN